MTIEPHTTKFDCVAFMREARDRISDKMTTMSHEEFRHWLRSFRYTDPALQRLADRLADSGPRRRRGRTGAHRPPARARR